MFVILGFVILILYFTIPLFQVAKLIWYPLVPKHLDLFQRREFGEWEGENPAQGLVTHTVLWKGASVLVYTTPPKFQKSVIFLHGAGTDWYSLVKHRRFFESQGWNCAWISFVEPLGRTWIRSSFGPQEASWVLQVRAHLEAQGWPTAWGLLGESLGASTGFYALAGATWQWLVADSGYSRLETVLEDLLRQILWIGPWAVGFPGWRSLRRWWVWIWRHWCLEDVEPHRHFLQCQCAVPILLVHGTEDRYVPAHHSISLKKMVSPPQRVELLVVEGARHTKSWRVDRRAYEEALLGFMEGTHVGN